MPNVHSCYFVYFMFYICVQSLPLYPTPCDPMDCRPPGSSGRGVLLARILEWVAIFFFRGSAPPRVQTPVFCVSCMAVGFLTTEPRGKPYFIDGASGKEPACQGRRCKDVGLIPGSGSPWRKEWQPTPVFLPGEPVDRGAWQATVHEVARVGHN